jgi:hypothetical protein
VHQARAVVEVLAGKSEDHARTVTPAPRGFYRGVPACTYLRVVRGSSPTRWATSA